MKNIFDKKAREEAKKQKQLNAARATVRKPEVISAEYNRICAELGDKNYRIKVIQTEIEQINQRLYQLNQEFHKADQVHAKTEAEKKAIVESTLAPKEATNVEAQPV